jgi:general secretion pathway protein A
MYETHFGFSGSPFQLNPDPAFYFDSRGHKNALAYLKFGAHQGEGFIVVTGEIGAGKTTLVRTLLDGLDPATVAAAQVVSTQLESGDLLRAILTAFGIPASGSSKAQLIASLEAFLTALAAKGRRALLVVDEAQNLDQRAVEELRMLSNFQLGTHGLLQSFLVGQPELRAILQSKSMEQLRQRVIASCHLGPLDDSESRAYVEHRLRLVGWNERPKFDADAFAQIYLWTRGVPRRINRLCNRILLAAYLAESDVITAELVFQTAQELHAEIGEGGAGSEERAAVPTTPIRDAAKAEPRTNLADTPAAQVVLRAAERPEAPVLCLVDTPAEYLAAGSLACAVRRVPALPPIVTVHTGAPEDVQYGADFKKALPLAVLDVFLHAGSPADATSAAATLIRFDSILREYAPSAVLCLGRSDSVRACSLWAHRRGVPVATLRSGQRRLWANRSEEENSELMERYARVLYAEAPGDYYTLHRAGIAAERMHSVGNLVSDSVRHCVPLLSEPATALSRVGVAGLVGSPYMLATLQFAPEQSRPQDLATVTELLTKAADRVPLLWLASAETLLELKARGMHARLESSRVQVLSDVPYLDGLTLLQGARCVLTDDHGRLVDEAMALGVAAVVLSGEGLFCLEPNEIPNCEPAVEWSQIDEVVGQALELTEPCSPASIEAGADPADELAAHLATWLAPALPPRATAVAPIESARRARTKGRAKANLP